MSTGVIIYVLVVGLILGLIQWSIHAENKRLGLTRKQRREQEKRWKVKQLYDHIHELELDLFGKIFTERLR